MVVLVKFVSLKQSIPFSLLVVFDMNTENPRNLAEKPLLESIKSPYLLFKLNVYEILFFNYLNQTAMVSKPILLSWKTDKRRLKNFLENMFSSVHNFLLFSLVKKI